MTQCSNHALFEKFLEQGLANLNTKLAEIVTALNEQNAASVQKWEQLTANQGKRMELCGERGAQIDALQKSDDAQWQAHRESREKIERVEDKLDKTNRLVWMGTGGMTLGFALVEIAVNLLFKH